VSYSLEKLPNKPYEFPPPPPYAVWVEELTWDYANQNRTRIQKGGQGQIRHVPDLAKAKKRVRSYAAWSRTGPATEFDADWTIYLWDQEKNEYVVQFEGFAGDTIAMNPLFAAPIKKVEAGPRPGLEDEVEAAIQSILGESA